MANYIIALIVLSVIVWAVTTIINSAKQKCPYDSKWDATDAACPAFWRGEKWSANQFCRLIADALSGKNNCTGRMHEPLETVRNNVFKLKQEWDIACDRNHDLENLAGKYLEEIQALEVERDMYKEYSYYVGSELTCKRTPNKYCKWSLEKS